MWELFVSLFLAATASMQPLENYWDVAPITSNKLIIAPYEDCSTYIGRAIVGRDRRMVIDRCIRECKATTEFYEKIENPLVTCRYVNTYMLYKNAWLIGQVCAMYTQAWNDTYALMAGWEEGDDVYTITNSTSIKNLSDTPNGETHCLREPVGQDPSATNDTEHESQYLSPISGRGEPPGSGTAVGPLSTESKQCFRLKTFTSSNPDGLWISRYKTHLCLRTWADEANRFTIGAMNQLFLVYPATPVNANEQLADHGGSAGDLGLGGHWQWTTLRCQISTQYPNTETLACEAGTMHRWHTSYPFLRLAKQDENHINEVFLKVLWTRCDGT